VKATEGCLLDSILRMGEHRATAAFVYWEETKLEMKRMKLAKYLAAAAAFAAVFTLVTTFPATAQNAPSQKQLNIAAMRAERKAVVGANMPMTKDEEKIFWPLYDEYEAKMDKIEERHIKEVREFVASYDTLTGADATKKLDEVMSIQQARLDVQKAYIPKFRAVLTSIQTTRFFQVDSKIRALVQCQIAQMVPLAKEPQSSAQEGQGGNNL
jgi:hypothetical protein